ncbi:aminotransferase class IV [Pseudonocardia broussonetiae]|nr:aminotransferase class IV [Pseudonocardia broussonetiae]
MSERAWFNGQVVPHHSADPSVASNTLHLGIAVFDGCVAYWNDDHWHQHLMREHMERFHRGAARMDLALPWGVEELLDGVHLLLDTLPRRTHYIRPIAYRTAPEVFFSVDVESTSACMFAVPITRDVDGAVRCQLSSVERVRHTAIDVTWKVSGAYANSYLCEREARRAGFDTGVMLNSAGLICEASSSNLFFVADRTLVTPRLDGDVFPGLTRALLIDQARAADITLVERDVHPAELPNFDAALLCGTLSEVRPVSCIGDVNWPSADDPTVRHVIDRFRRSTHR